jgi:formylglycine-generating enzyme required for sulfatase activity
MLQVYATKAGESLTQGDGASGTGWNYYDGVYATDPSGPWDVGSGSEELNGTYDMMGNVWEWMESPYSDSSYGANSPRSLRGGSFYGNDSYLHAWYRISGTLSTGLGNLGFRVASVPEPGSVTLLVSGLLACLTWWRRRK